MTTRTLTLTEFLLARFADDERRWGNPAFIGVAGPDLSALVKHMRADIEAKRRIVDDIVTQRYLDDVPITDGLAWRVLRDLAGPYADHPDYREEWRP